MNFTDVSILGIVVATFANMIIGGLWYSPVLFANAWMKGMGKKRSDFNQQDAKVGYLLTIVAGFVSAYVLSLFIQLLDTLTVEGGAMVGLLAGLGIAAMRELSPTVFESRRWVLFVISAGYHVVALTVMGMIVAAYSL